MILFLKGRRRYWHAWEGGENRKCMFCQCPLWKQEPLSIKNSANYYVLEKMVLVGKTAGTEARNVLVTGTGLIVNC